MMQDLIDQACLLLKPSGRICLGGKLPELQADIQEALKTERPKVVVDLSGVEYMDSSGLGEIVRLYLESKKKGKSLVLAAVPPQLGKVLKSSKLDRVFTVVETVEKALA